MRVSHGGSGRLLVFHSGALGDVVATFANLLHLGKHWPGGIDGVCQDHIGRLGRDLGIFRRVFAAESARFAALYTASADPSLAAWFHPYRAVVLFSNSLALEQGVSGVFPHRVVRIPPRPPSGRRNHIHDHVFEHLLAAGLIGAADADGLLSRLSAQAAERRPGGGGPAGILIHPGSGSPRKNWPLAHFTALARRLCREGMSPAFIIGPAETDLVRKIGGDAAWKIHMPADIDALAQVLAAADGYIGNDSGVSHLAAFLGLPTLTLFGPSDPLRWRPRGPRTAVLAAAGLSCAPCFERCRENCTEAPCLSGITVAAAAERFIDLLSGR